jgi:G3E family GTPase
MSTPVTVLTGFLGSGKTSLLTHILTNAAGRKFGVLVNDFSELNIDAQLIQSVDDNQIALSNGCICCTIRDDLVSAIVKLLLNDPKPEHVIIEASGLSDPLGIAETLHQPQLSHVIEIESIVALCDASTYKHLNFFDSEMVLQQIAVADLVLINKIDLAEEADIARIRKDVSLASPKARLLNTEYGSIPISIILGSSDSDSYRDVHAHQSATLATMTCVDEEHHHGAHNEYIKRFESWSWRSSRPLCLEKFTSWANQLSTEIYRAKGILYFSEPTGIPSVFQLVGKRSTITRLEVHNTESRSELVLIGLKGTLTQHEIDTQLNSCIHP